MLDFIDKEQIRLVFKGKLDVIMTISNRKYGSSGMKEYKVSDPLFQSHPYIQLVEYIDLAF